LWDFKETKRLNFESTTLRNSFKNDEQEILPLRVKQNNHLVTENTKKYNNLSFVTILLDSEPNGEVNPVSS